MSITTLPGDLVALRLRWNLDSYRLGLVVALHHDTRLVLWATDEGVTELVWNQEDAIVEVSTSDLGVVKGRWRRLGT